MPDTARPINRHPPDSSQDKSSSGHTNALAESFFDKIKTEWLHRFVFTSREKARREIVKYIEGFYNTQRIHSGLGYKTPTQVYNEYLNQQAAA